MPHASALPAEAPPLVEDRSARSDRRRLPIRLRNTLLTVLLVGAFVIGPASDQMLDGEGDTTGRLIAASAYDVVALTVATALGVFKPGRAFRSNRRPRNFTTP